MHIKRFDSRVIIGALLILAGVLGLLQTLGILKDVSETFWGIVYLLAGAAFLTVFVRRYSKGGWWAVIPGLVLPGIGLLKLFPEFLDNQGDLVVLGSIGLSFWLVYLTERSRWWAIIPGGVLLTLATMRAFPDDFLGGSGDEGILFLGIALTFLLVALLTGRRWAYWPGASLAVFGILLFFQSQIFLLPYLAAIGLIAAGIVIIWRSIRGQK
ncbi:MAG: hypothetical protein QGM50_07890 [Anaerolineae bacterium]|nr:hypothetical protein [Anaerolineae bacterium]MDK1082076.1 hypothetical protein [Anaerolineae bacterium]MDK1118695.1 hypothetical protein [Anaerolineae bacterium]